MFLWTNIYTIEMFIFINILQNVNFEQPQFQGVGVKLSEYFLFELLFFRVLGKNCFKDPKVPLDKYF